MPALEFEKGVFVVALGVGGGGGEMGEETLDHRLREGTLMFADETLIGKRGLNTMLRLVGNRVRDSHVLPVLIDEVREDQSLPFESPFVAKVDQIADWQPCDTHVIEELSVVLGEKLHHRFELRDETAEDNKVRNIALLQFSAFVRAL